MVRLRGSKECAIAFISGFEGWDDEAYNARIAAEPLLSATLHLLEHFGMLVEAITIVVILEMMNILWERLFDYERYDAEDA